MAKYNVLSIDYYKNFQCIGNKCEEHCCKGWKISVDKKTYGKYRKLISSDFSKKLNDSINRNRKSQNQYDYAKINLVDGKCPMFSENSLCEVYSNLGRENMCYTCRTYPRIYNQVDNMLEQCLTVSCIEVAKNILLRKDPIEFDLDLKEITEEININRLLLTSKGKNISQKYFNEIREFSIGLIQNRKFTIENRLAILGIFINKLNDECIDIEGVTRVIDEYTRSIKSGVFDNLTEVLIQEDKFDAQLEFMMNIYKEIISKTITNKRYINNFVNIVNTLQLDSEDAEKIKESYRESLNNYYRKFMREHEYIYENYLVNYMFKNLFPSIETSILNSYITLIVQFSILKMNLIGISGYYKEEMNIEKVLNLIQSYAAVTEHDQFLVGKINKYLNENKLNTLAHILILMGK